MKKQDVENIGTVAGADQSVPVEPASSQINRYNITSPRGFSVYNDEGSALYRGEVERVASQLRAELFGEEFRAPETTAAPEAQAKPKRAKEKSKAYDGKRVFFLVLSLIVSLAVIAMAVIGVIESASLDVAKEYTSIFNADGTYVTIFDPCKGLLELFGAKGLEPVYEFDFGTDTLGKIITYAFPICQCVYLFGAVLVLIHSIVGLAKKKKGGVYTHKPMFGLISILMFVFAIVTTISGVMASGLGFENILTFLQPGGGFSAGYGLYVMLGAPIITFVCSTCSFRRAKKTVEA